MQAGEKMKKKKEEKDEKMRRQIETKIKEDLEQQAKDEEQKRLKRQWHEEQQKERAKKLKEQEVEKQKEEQIRKVKGRERQLEEERQRREEMDLSGQNPGHRKLGLSWVFCHMHCFHGTSAQVFHRSWYSLFKFNVLRTVMAAIIMRTINFVSFTRSCVVLFGLNHVYCFKDPTIDYVV
jgi:hypothetical protein